MTEASINPTQLCRRAFIYVRQSTQTQVQRNRESTQRQYELADHARSLGWSPDQVEIIDEDLGQSGASSAERTGFARLTAEVALGQAGIVLGLEVSRLARNNADWYRLLDLCGLTGDADGIYHPRQHNDRLILGLKDIDAVQARLGRDLGGLARPAQLAPLQFDLEVLFHLVAVQLAAQAALDRGWAPPRLTPAPHLAGNLLQDPLGGLQQLLALARALLLQARVEAHQQALAGELRAVDLSHLVGQPTRLAARLPRQPASRQPTRAL